MAEMKTVDSSNVKAIGKDGHKLLVQFHSSGDTWEYDHAAHHYTEMLKPSCQSVGGYFYSNIRNKYPGRKAGS